MLMNSELSEDMLENKKERDINDVFSDILFSEENVIEEAYQESFSLGLAQGNTDGYHLGYHRGAEVGAEIGYYTGIIEIYLKYYENSETRNEKIITALKNLKESLDTYPRDNSEDVDLIESINNIRAKFKKICTQIGLNAQYLENNSLSF